MTVKGSNKGSRKGHGRAGKVEGEGLAAARAPDAPNAAASASEVAMRLVRGSWLIALGAVVGVAIALAGAGWVDPQYEAGTLVQASRGDSPAVEAADEAAKEVRAKADEANALAEEALLLAEEAGPEAAAEARVRSEEAEARSEEAERRASESAAAAAERSASADSTPGERAQGYARLVNQPSVMGPAVEPLGLEPQEIEGVLLAEASPTDPMMEVVAKSGDPEKAADLANAAAGALEKHTRKLAEASGGGYQADVIAEALPPANPFFPNETIFAGVGGLSGLTVGAVLALMLYDGRTTGPARRPVRAAVGRASRGVSDVLSRPAASKDRDQGRDESPAAVYDGQTDEGALPGVGAAPDEERRAS